MTRFHKLAKSRDFAVADATGKVFRKAGPLTIGISVVVQLETVDLDSDTGNYYLDFGVEDCTVEEVYIHEVDERFLDRADKNLWQSIQRLRGERQHEMAELLSELLMYRNGFYPNAVAVEQSEIDALEESMRESVATDIDYHLQDRW